MVLTRRGEVAALSSDAIGIATMAATGSTFNELRGMCEVSPFLEPGIAGACDGSSLLQPDCTADAGRQVPYCGAHLGGTRAESGTPL